MGHYHRVLTEKNSPLALHQFLWYRSNTAGLHAATLDLYNLRHAWGDEY